MDKIGVLDFGGQYAHLIANRLRRLGVFSEVLPAEVDPQQILGFKGIILSGGPASVYEESAPKMNPEVLKQNVPVLGLCYGHQLIANIMGGQIKKGHVKEYGSASLQVLNKETIFRGLEDAETVWMSHGDSIKKLPAEFTVIGRTQDCECAAVENFKKKIYGFQFHPEVTHTPNGLAILSNFLDICSCTRNWSVKSYMHDVTEEIRRKVGNRKVFLLVSGGVDSTVVFSLLNEALGEDRVLGVHIDTGLMRKDESKEIVEALGGTGFPNLEVIDASSDFLTALGGVAEPEKKRKIIGEKFLDVKDAKMAGIDLESDAWVLAQGTIYPDTIESGGTKNAAVIKTHHNRVDKIQELMQRDLLLEPVSNLYKDEVRKLGEELGLPKALVWRHPFPGPGLGVRILCSGKAQAEPALKSLETKIGQTIGQSKRKVHVLPIKSVGVQGDSRTYAHPAVVTGEIDFTELEAISTQLTNRFAQINRVLLLLQPNPMPRLSPHECYLTQDRIEKAREADHVAHSVLMRSGMIEVVWQMPVVLLPLIDESMNEAIVLRPVLSQEAMTARFAPLPGEVINEMTERILEIEGISTLFYDITHKPPGTIEWE